MLSAALIGLMYRTLSSNLIPDSVKMRRVKVCAEAMEVASLPITPEIFNVVYQRDEWEPLLSSVEFGLFLTKANHNDRSTAYYSQIIISNVIASVQEHDERWFELATGQLGVPGNVLRHYLAHGDSALLANCIHIIRYIVRDYSQPGSSIGAGSRAKTLKLVSKLDIQSTLPELQHEFCALWNEIVLGMWNTEDPLIQHASVTVLSHIRHLYLGLHEGTDSAQPHSPLPPLIIMRSYTGARRTRCATSQDIVSPSTRHLRFGMSLLVELPTHPLPLHSSSIR
jgi:hypothetical protein